MTTLYELSCGYTKLGVGTVPSSAPTITVIDSANNILVAALTAVTALTNLPGAYRYSYSGADGLIVYGLFHTSDLTMDQYDLFVVANAPTIIYTSLAISSTVAAGVSVGNMVIEAGYTFRQTITSTYAGDLSAATKLWLAIKDMDAGADDAHSQIFIEKTGGLTVVNGLPYTTTTHGSLAVTGTPGAWSIAIYIDEVATALLFGKNKGYTAGVKAIIGSDDVAIWEGERGTKNGWIVDGVVRAL